MTVTYTPRAAVPLAQSGGVAVGDPVTMQVFLTGDYDRTAGTGTSERALFIYHPPSNTWTEGAPFPTVNRTGPIEGNPGWGAGAAIVNRVLYLCGMDQSPERTFAYRINVDSWSIVAPHPDMRSFPAAVGAGGYLYSFGGVYLDSGQQSNRAYRYDPTTNVWTRIADMPMARSRMGAAVIGDKIYCLGGPAGDAHHARMDVYTISTNTWAVGPTMPRGRSFPQVHEVTGKLYVMGAGIGTAVAATTVVDKYDPDSNAWTVETPIPDTAPNRTMFAVGQLNSELFLLGGRRTQFGPVETTENLRALVNTAPLAPLLLAPADGDAIDYSRPNRFRWQFRDLDVGDTQSRFTFYYRPAGSAATLSGVDVTSPNNYYDLPAGTLTGPATYEWYVETYDALGFKGARSASAQFTTALSPPGPVITSPTNNATVGASHVFVSWSTDNQEAFRVQALDVAGNVVHDSGELPESATRTYRVPLPTNSTERILRVVTRKAGLLSPAADVRVQVSYTLAAKPEARLRVTEQGIDVQVVNPTPTGGQPVAVRNELERAVVVGGEVVSEGMLRDLSSSVPTPLQVLPNRNYEDFTVTSAVPYAYRWHTLGANDTRSVGEWQTNVGNNDGPVTASSVYNTATYNTATYG